jgi:hypothetical protein
MRPFARVSLILAAVAGLLVVALAIALLLAPESDLIRRKVEDQLKGALGQDVSLGSVKMSASFPSLLHIAVDRISVKDAQGIETLAAEKISLSPAIFPLFRGRLSIDSIRIVGLRTSVVRDVDGTTRVSFAPTAPGPASKQPASDQTPNVEPGGRNVDEGRIGPSDARPDDPVIWSIKNVTIERGRIDWIDRRVQPGRDVVISIVDLAGDMEQTGSPTAFSVRITATAANETGGKTEIKSDGAFSLSDDRACLESCQLKVSAEAVDLGLFQAYLSPKAAALTTAAKPSLAAELNWAPGREAVFSARAFLTPGQGQGASLKADAKGAASGDFSALKEVRLQGEIDGLPLKTISALIMADLPLDPSTGVIKAQAEGTWTGDRKWNAKGTASLQNAAPRGKIAVIAKRMGISARCSLTPEALTLEAVEVTEPRGLVSIEGKIEAPFSADPLVDLTAKVSIEPGWAPGLGARLPETLRILGMIPVQAKVKGNKAGLAFGLSAGLSNTLIAWTTFLEKPRGAKGGLSFEGKLVPGAVVPGKGLELDGHLQVDLSGVAIRSGPGPGSVTDGVVLLRSKIKTRGKKTDAQDIVMSLKGPQGKRDILTVTGAVADITSKSPGVQGNAALALDQSLVALAAPGLAAEVTVKGSAAAKGKFSGNPALLTMSLDAPLHDLDVSVGKNIRKPGGVAGSLTASADLSGRRLTLKDARLTLKGGVTAIAKGRLSDDEGRFGELALELPKTGVENLLSYAPGLKVDNLSGHVEASVTIAASDKGLEPKGYVRLSDVNYHPEKAGWGLDKIRGQIEIKGDAVACQELSGQLSGLVAAPVKASGALNRVGSPAAMEGRVSIAAGKGRIKATPLTLLIGHAKSVVSGAIDPSSIVKDAELLDIDYLKGDIDFKAGKAATDNVKLKGPAVSAGLIGAVQVDTGRVDAFAGFHAMIQAGNLVGNIPAVKEVLKQNKGLLKALGLDKELDRLGVKIPEGNEQTQAPSTAAKTPMTVFLRMEGPMSDAKVTPILESAIKEGTLKQLKSLMH